MASANNIYQRKRYRFNKKASYLVFCKNIFENNKKSIDK